MLCGHVDTVGVEGMERAVRAGRTRRTSLRPRGAGHEGRRGGDDRRRPGADREWFRRGRVVVAAVVDEEYASIGADALVGRWSADLAVVTEPTDLTDRRSRTKGFVWIDVETHGRAAHGSRPGDGRDAILRDGTGARAARSARSRAAVAAAAPADGHGVAARVDDRGGRELSSYPASLHAADGAPDAAGRIGRGRRIRGGRILDSAPARGCGFTADMRVTFSRPPYELPHGTRAAELLGDGAHRARPSAGVEVGMSFWTDAAILGGQASRPCCSDPAAPGCTDGRNT